MNYVEECPSRLKLQLEASSCPVCFLSMAVFFCCFFSLLTLNVHNQLAQSATYMLHYRNIIV